MNLKKIYLFDYCMNSRNIFINYYYFLGAFAVYLKFLSFYSFHTTCTEHETKVSLIFAEYKTTDVSLEKQSQLQSGI